MRNKLLGAALLAAAATSAVGVAPAAAATRTFSCMQTTVTRAQYKQAVSGTLDSANVPHNVVVTRTYTGKTEISSANPTLDSGLDGGYWNRTYGWNAWSLGSVSGNNYWFLFPPSPGSTFDGMVYIKFGPNGSYGNWQHHMSCTAS